MKKTITPKPPALADALLKWLLAPELLEVIQGDLLESFYHHLKRSGVRNARLRYWSEVLGFLKPAYIRRKNAQYPSSSFISLAMIRNYFKIAWRNIWRKKAFTTINIVGLGAGLATCMLIMLFVQHELSYDKFNKNADRIFRMTIAASVGGKEVNAAAPAPSGPALTADYAGIESFTRLSEEGSFLVKRDAEQFKEEGVVFADSNFFSFFTIPLSKGNVQKVLTEPNTMVITESTKTKYFGNEDPVGKNLTLGGRGLFRITGVCEDVPSNSHFHYDFFVSMRSTRLGEKWLASSDHTYFLLRENYPVESLRAENANIIKKYVASEIREFLGMSYEEFVRKGDKFGFQFQPLTDIHLYSHGENELEPNSDVRYVYIFSAIALFILLIACINFMNLSTAGSANRAKEVGVRKVLGSKQYQLIRQFLTESVLLSFLALVVACILVILALPGFNALSGKQFNIWAVFNLKSILYIISGCLGIGLLSGIYPAFFLSAFKPIAMLKGNLQAGMKSGWLRNSLVTVQFVVSIGMIIATLVVYQQLRFIQNKKVGFDKDKVIILHDTYVLRDKTDSFRQELSRLSQISSVSLAGYVPAGTSNKGVDGFRAESAPDESTPFRLRTYNIDENYLSTLGIGLSLGRNFSKSFSSDSAAVLVNEAAVKQFGWKNPIGQRITTIGDGNVVSRRTYTVVGVTKDFHFESMHEQIAPLIMYFWGDHAQIALRVNTSHIPDLLKVLERTWKAHTDSPFSYSFLDERFNKMYDSEKRIGKLFGIFAGLGVVIACLGLFGLATFTTVQRTKEIGVRKVLGASVFSIVALLSQDFIKLVLVAICIATPLAWYGMGQWLQDFAYRVDMAWWMFVLAGLLAVSIALLTVSYQSIKAALVNPVKTLRSE